MQLNISKCLQSLNKSDILIIYKLDRIGRSVREVVNILYDLEQRKIDFISLSDHLDTTNPQGRLMLNILLSFSQFERELTVQRVNAGLKAAKDKGIKLGSPVRIDRIKAKQVYDDKYKFNLTIEYILEKYHISKRTYYNYISLFQ